MRRFRRVSEVPLAVYEEWYDLIVERLPSFEGQVVELGSGGGFLASHIPGLIESDVFPVLGIDRIVDARNMVVR